MGLLPWAVASIASREEVAAWRDRCPIKRLRVELIAKKLATEAELNAIDAEIQAEVTAASQAAEQAPWPEAAAATTHVYCGQEPGAGRQEAAVRKQWSVVSSRRRSY